MGKDYLIGVDLGTSVAKAGVYDTEGTLLGEATQETQVRYPQPGLAEQDPAEFYQSTVATIRAAMDRAGIDAAGVAALSIDSQAGGIMAIDRHWQPVTHFDSPLDTRSAAQAHHMVELGGTRMVELAGVSPTYGQKILWWRDERPEAWKRMHAFIQPAAYVAGLMSGLAGEAAYMEPTFMCWSGLSDSANARWSTELCSLFEVPMRVLPRVAQAWEVVGHLTSEAARACGLPSGLPIAAGTADAAASLLGAGVCEPGLVFDISGTACIFGACVDQYRPDATTKTLCSMNGILPGQFYQMSIVLAGRTHDWFVDEFCREESAEAAAAGTSVYALMDARAAALPEGSDGVFCIPQLSGRWYPPEPEVRGLWLGFGWGHHKEHLYRSILESVAYEYSLYLGRMRELLPELRLREVRVMGGGGRSGLWNQIKSSVLGIPYGRLPRQDLATWGSALIAGHAVGIFPDLAAAAKARARVVEQVEPDATAHKRYAPFAALYPTLFDCNRAAFAALEKIRAGDGHV